MHYPTVSGDMLEEVERAAQASPARPSLSPGLMRARAKLLYYRAFVHLYRACGRLATVVCVNSSWTQNHICNLWRKPKSDVALVYPPCNTVRFMANELDVRGGVYAVPGARVAVNKFGD